MFLKNIHLSLTAVVLAVSSLVPQIAYADINFAVMSPSGAIEAQKKWKSLTDGLSASLGETVNLVPLSPGDVIGAVDGGRVDYVLANPVLSAAIVSKHTGAQHIAGLNKKSGNTFGGVIFSKAGSGIAGSADVAGKKILSYKIGRSAGAYVFQAYHLKQAGVTLPDGVASVKEAKTQNNIVKSVKIGVADVGFVRTGILEKMQKKGEISLSDFMIIDAKKTPGGEVLSTDLYPEWQVVAAPGADSSKSGAIKTYLTGLSEGSAESEAAGIKGFSEPVDLSGIITVLSDLKIAPFDN